MRNKLKKTFRNQAGFGRLGIIIAIIVIVAALAVYFMLREGKEEPIKIGGILMLSRTASDWGLNSQKGADLAIEQINAEGGINNRRLEIVYEDNQGDDARAAVSAFFKLLKEDIKIILGSNWSPSGLALAPLACDKKVLMISPSLGVAGFNEECDYLFNVWPHDSLLSQELAKLVYHEGHRNIALLGSQQTWEQEQAFIIKETFENLGGEVVSFQLPSKEEREFSNEVQNIKQIDPEAVVLTLGTASIGLAAKNLYKAGVRVPLYAVLITDQSIQDAQGSLEGAVVTTSFTPNREFAGLFVSKYGEQPDIGSDTSYDAIKLIAQAIEETGSTDPTVVKDYINSLEKYKGVSGSLIFDGKGGVTKPFKFTVVKGNKIANYEVETK